MWCCGIALENIRSLHEFSLSAKGILCIVERGIKYKLHFLYPYAALSKKCSLKTDTAGNLCWYSTQSRNTPLLSDRQIYSFRPGFSHFFYLARFNSYLQQLDRVAVVILSAGLVQPPSASIDFALWSWHVISPLPLSHQKILPVVSSYNFKEL